MDQLREKLALSLKWIVLLSIAVIACIFSALATWFALWKRYEVAALLGFPPATSASTANTCGSLTFVSYQPSKAETAWGAELVAHDPVQLCPLLAKPELESWVQVWITSALAAAADLRVASARPSTAHDDFLVALHRAAALDLTTMQDVFSIMWFKDECSGARVPLYVEPLLGTLRDPRPVCGGWSPPLDEIMSRETIVLDSVFLRRLRLLRLASAPADSEAAVRRAPPRVLVFDLGSSTYEGAPQLQSLKWIVEDRLLEVGLLPDAVLAWEKASDAKTFFTGMPAWLSNVTQFLGAITMEDGAEQNPLVQLRRVARPDDFVLFKLDFDFSEWEWRIVQALRSDASLGALVDVFFWEHHHQLGEMVRFWGSGTDGRHPLESFREFTALREQGIAAHVWP